MRLDGRRRRRGMSRLRFNIPLCCVVVVVVVACDDAHPELRPDDLLRSELGLDDSDRVHRVVITATHAERIDPAEVVVRSDAYVEFRTDDWRVHEVRFELDSLAAEARAFLEETDQAASPPLLERDSRFVVSFRDAPSGRYPFVVEGNTLPGRGAVVVDPAEAR